MPPTADGCRPIAARFAMRGDASLSVDAAGVVRLLAPSARIGIGTYGPGALAALGLLERGATEQELVAAVIANEGSSGLASWAKVFLILRHGNWLERRLEVDGMAVATLRPVRFGPEPRASAAPGALVALSRFAVVRRDGPSLLVESPRARSLVVLNDPAGVELLGRLNATMDLDAVVGADPFLPTETARAVLGMLDEAGLLIRLAADEPDEEASDAELAQWSAVDLLFHARSRLGRNTAPYGGSFPLEGRFEPLPARKPAAAPLHALAVPASPARALDELLESRSSIREHDDAAPIELSQLAELLYRTSRLRSVIETAHGEVASRPYPSGGSLYELEIYPVIRLCEGVQPGVYRYDGAEHALEEVASVSPKMDRLLELARVTATMTERPQVLLVVTARFGRVMWKYSSIGYALILKHVGVLYQTLYLVATELGLAPCALGGGDSDLFGEIAGLSFEEEASVGEFVLGSVAAPRPT